MNIAIVGCGYVADYYLRTLPNYPDLNLVGVMDIDQERATRFAEYHSLSAYHTLEELLADPRVNIVVNLTNPKSHFSVSKASLEAGKHVYSEKPLAMSFSEAEELVELAEKKGLYISSAPCNLLSETAQTVWNALQNKEIGRVFLAYAELDDGLVHRRSYQKWLSDSGIPWPYKDEFEVGCTLEHAGYYVTWLTAFFGPAKTVTAFSSCLVSDKEIDVPLDVNAPDFSVACIKFASGVVARITCSIIAPHNHSLQIFGDEGVLYVDDCWNYASPVYIQPLQTSTRKTFGERWRSISNKLAYFYKTLRNPTAKPLPTKKHPLVKEADYNHLTALKMDFCRGIAELAEAIAQQRSCRISARYSLHVNEIVLAIQNSLETGSSYTVTSSFEPIEPMPWAKP